MVTKTKTAPGASELSGGQIAGYLRDNPDFLDNNPDLLAVLTPPGLRTGRGVVDMQRFIIERLQGELDRHQSNRRDLIDAGRDNYSSQGRIHTAVLRLLEARTFEHLLEIITDDLVELLEIDVSKLCFESNDSALVGLRTRSVRVLAAGQVGRLMGKSDIALRSGVGGDRTLFGTHAEAIRSDALVRLDISSAAPAGLLALGSSDKARFHPGQGSELLKFLGEALGRCVRTWLDLPG